MNFLLAGFEYFIYKLEFQKKSIISKRKKIQQLRKTKNYTTFQSVN